MKKRPLVELWVGLFVAIGILALTMLAFRVANLSTAEITDGYNLKARFENIGQLKVKAPIKMAGVNIGRVADISINEQYYAIVTLNISNRYNNLPEDTSAAIFTSGLLGEQYIALEPGGSEIPLKEGDTIRLTQSALVLEKLIGQFLFKAAESATTK
jgi:phospholipid/cholesterol/gamma-HCH transport system substrate-binding protein